jgi:hypothetical protein
MQPLDNEPLAHDSARQEVELWWGGYAARTMLPSLGLCLLATVALLGAAVYFSGHAGPRGPMARWWAYGLTAAIWLYQFLRWAYRVAGYEYRLTSRRLYCGWGPLTAPPPPVELADLETVRVEQTALHRWLGVGQIVLVGQERAIPLVLEGVRSPEHMAAVIRRAADRSREPSASLAVQS